MEELLKNNKKVDINKFDVYSTGILLALMFFIKDNSLFTNNNDILNAFE